MKITVLAIGKLRGAAADWCADYLKRMNGLVTVRELAAAKSLTGLAAQKAEHDLLMAALPAGATLVLLDEQGKDLASRAFAQQLQGWQEQAIAQLVFVIGGADGVLPALRERASFIWGFGRATWPHRLARVMLLEQLYRARQINAGHPYHRD